MTEHLLANEGIDDLQLVASVLKQLEQAAFASFPFAREIRLVIRGQILGTGAPQSGSVLLSHCATALCAPWAPGNGGPG